MIILESLFFRLAETSGLVSLLMVPLFLLRPWLRRWVGSPWLCVLWLLILGRLLLPLPVESRWSLSSYWPRQVEPQAQLVTEPAKARVSVLPAGSEAPIVAPETVMAPPLAQKFSVVGLLGVLWAAGVAMGIAGLGIRIWKTRRLAAQTRPVTDAWTLGIYESIPAATRRNVPLRVTTALDIPTLAGVIRPQIWLPADWERKLTSDEMRQVLLHELGHAHRRDLLVQWLFAVAQCLHWFNPLVWVFARAARFDREMACDAWVLTQGEGSDPAQYGATLLKITRILSNPLRSAPGGAAMATSKRSLTTRIAGIGAFCQRPSWCGIVGVGIVLGGLAVFTTRGVAVEESLASVTEPIPANSPAVLAPTSEVKVETAQVKIEAKFLELPDSLFVEWIAPGGVLAHTFTPAPVKKGGAGAEGNGSAILDAPKLEALIRALNMKRGVDLLSAPSVTTRSSNRAKIEIIREFRYATEFALNKEVPPQYIPTAFETKNVGVTLSVTPTVEADGKTIAVHAIPELVKLQGFKGLDGKELPGEGEPVFDGIKFPRLDSRRPYILVFSEYKLDTKFRLLSGQSAVLRFGTKTLLEKGRTPKKVALVAFVTAKILTSAEVAANQAAYEAEKAAEIAKLEADGIPFGVVKPGDKEGHVHSPFAPDAGLVDVRGYDAGTGVRCPYTGKTFRVPSL